ncbi:MAG TPA: hypothetical protein DCL95_05185 [Rhodospirillaceae bacterium]|jgi:uncharacterized protein (DUF302 family)|uniref:DUF302 domain-containing protein n=1 Tax=unclassified Hwanghaeella TaxID=2605944 RepID=UPI000C3A655E|nr:hypothetical protein [Rhodospirillaceae bacterium]MAO92744.1 hypothetical protein [Rhodospirillales bacterium]HBR40703.1 hypothetical protein [Sulfitobacter pontiacus]MAX64902.1 hypothetical protein [Rhodospirillaceae bacterium]MBB57135.1 hypothetical protein [Rhodospirillaceae bacterium]|tara:strand:- start:9342 stop:9830 length:489 start_codon:yes stop_codon:yes gene_type:complete
MYRIVAFAVFMMLMVSSAQALQPREGWVIQHSQKPFDLLLADLKQAVTDNKMGLVTEAGPTAAAASRGVELPGNRVVGVFRVDFAIRILPLSEAAMIEAPIRFYVTEDPDGGATLSYKAPSFVFSPYLSEGGEGLAEVASELDAIFSRIAEKAIQLTSYTQP